MRLTDPPRASDRTTGAPPDVETWARLREADPDALASLFNRHVDAVYNFAFRRTASWASADDVTQATFLTTWRRASAGSLPELDHQTALPWLLGVADHESRDLYRGLLRRQRLHQRLDSVRPSKQHETDHAESVTQQLHDEQQMARIREAVRVLPAHQRVVVELVVWSRLSVAETASALGVAEGTVKSRMSRAKRRLGAALTPTTHAFEEDR